LPAPSGSGDFSEPVALDERDLSGLFWCGIVQQPVDVAEAEPPRCGAQQPAADALPAVVLDHLQVADVGQTGAAGVPFGEVEYRRVRAALRRRAAG
jgi:hypothetical protein